MLRVYFYHFANNTAEFVFKCRNKNIKFTLEMAKEIEDEINAVANLRFTKEEIDFISNIPYHKNATGFIEFLRMYQLNKDYIKIMYTPQSQELVIRAKGPLFQVSMWEIYVLAIVQEVYWKHISTGGNVRDEWKKQGIATLRKELQKIKNENIKITEFGTRRRHSKSYHDEVLQILMKEIPQQLFGTSNVYYAMKYNLRPVGTMAHEYMCLGQGLNNVPIIESQRHMLDVWSHEYDGNLGTALTDTLGDDKWLKDFTGRFAKLFDGLRHDSGDPCIWGDKMIQHYQKLNIDPKTKYLMFSDSLNIDRAIKINNYFRDRIPVSFGIGTFLTNNIPSLTPLNNVFKMTSANNRPVAKLSADPGKAMCEDEKYLAYLQYAIAQ